MKNQFLNKRRKKPKKERKNSEQSIFSYSAKQTYKKGIQKQKKEFFFISFKFSYSLVVIKCDAQNYDGQ